MLSVALARQFIAARGNDVNEASPQLRVALDDVVCQARTREPSIELDLEVFIPYLGERSQTTPDLAEYLRMLHPGDLWLACACAHGNKRAMIRFQSLFAADIEQAVKRSSNTNVSPDDFRQLMLGKLFTAPDNHPPRITEYNGQGSLRGWLRVTIVRQIIDLVRRNQRRDLGHQVHETELLELRAAANDPELAYMRDTYQSELREALTLGFASLTPRERNILRHHLVHGLGIDEVARMYGVHRATAHRWRQKAQQNLLEVTRASLRDRLGVDTRGVKEVLNAVHNNLHITVRRYLSTNTEDER